MPLVGKPDSQGRSLRHDRRPAPPLADARINDSTTRPSVRRKPVARRVLAPSWPTDDHEHHKYTEKAQEAIAGAQQLADREGHPEITPEHLLLTLVEQQGGIVPEILRKLNAIRRRVATAVRAELGRSCRARTAGRSRRCRRGCARSRTRPRPRPTG